MKIPHTIDLDVLEAYKNTSTHFPVVRGQGSKGGHHLHSGKKASLLKSVQKSNNLAVREDHEISRLKTSSDEKDLVGYHKRKVSHLEREAAAARGWPPGLKAENFVWDSKHVEKLSKLCVETIAKNWEDFPVNELPLGQDQQLLLNLLPSRLPLRLLGERISDDAFWTRAYRERWTVHCAENRPFVQLYLEAHLAEELENLQPRAYDPEKMSELVGLCAAHVHNLKLTSLQPGEPNHPTDWLQQEDIATAFKNRAALVYRDHIPLSGVLSGLPLLTELRLTFGLKKAGAYFNRDLFQLTPADLRYLARGLSHCKNLKHLGISRSDLDDSKLKSILVGLGAAGGTVRSLEIRSCRLADKGALLLAKYALHHPSCRSLILTDNHIGVKGSEGLAHMLGHSASRVLTLDLRLNSLLGSAGAANIAAALIRGSILQNLNLSGCGIGREPIEGAPDCGRLIAAAVASGRSPLRDVDLSVNDLGPAAGQALLSALESRAGAGPSSLSVRAAGCGRWEGAIRRAALRTAAKRAAAATRFRRGAARLLAANRVARAIGIVEADPLQLARQLTSRPSAVSAISALSALSLESELIIPPLVDLEPLTYTLPPLGNPLISSPTSSVTEGTSRRSSYHGSTHRAPAVQPVQEVRRSALVRRSSLDGSLPQGPRSGGSQRKIQIFVSKTEMGKKGK